MSYHEFETLLALHCLKAPLDPNPTTDVDKIVNKLRLQYRTVCCEFHMLPYNSFGRLALGKKTTFVVIVDDCGNTWRCIAVYATRPYAHIKIGGSWGRLVDAQRLAIGVKIKVGVPSAGRNETVFITIKHPNVF